MEEIQRIVEQHAKLIDDELVAEFAYAGKQEPVIESDLQRVNSLRRLVFFYNEKIIELRLIKSAEAMILAESYCRIREFVERKLPAVAPLRATA